MDTSNNILEAHRHDRQLASIGSLPGDRFTEALDQLLADLLRVDQILAERAKASIPASG